MTPALDIGTGPVPLDLHGHGPGGFAFLDPLIGLGGLVLMIALVVGTLLLLHRAGLLPRLSPTARPTSPETSARQILAERMARGELSTEEFMERASVLNWTPGSDLQPPRRSGRRRP